MIRVRSSVDDETLINILSVENSVEYDHCVLLVDVVVVHNIIHEMLM